MTALTVAAVTASGIPRAGPNSRPAASVNAVRGNGKTVITMWAPRNASGNHGTDRGRPVAQLESGGQWYQHRDCDEDHNCCEDREKSSRRHAGRRREHRGTQGAQGADDGIHGYLDYVASSGDTRRRGL